MVLAIHPTTTGFGWTLFNGPHLLLNWGVVTVQKDKNVKCLEKAKELLTHYNPKTLVLEEFEGKKSKRSDRVKKLYRAIIKLAKAQNTKVNIITRAEISMYLFDEDGATRQEVAEEVSERVEGLKHLLPPKRKPWMSEDPKMGLFCAAALALVYFFTVKKKL